MNEEEDFFVLLHSIMKKIRTIANRELIPLGMNHIEMRILMMMYLYYPDGCSQEELISKLEIDRSNVGRSLKKLEQLGYIERETDSQDRRAYRVFLTENSDSIRMQLYQIRETLYTTISTAMTQQEFTLLLQLLKKTDKHISEENYRNIKYSKI